MEQVRLGPIREGAGRLHPVVRRSSQARSQCTRHQLVTHGIRPLHPAPTERDVVKKIAANGFQLPPPKDSNMYGQGIYFATDTTKSAQSMYTGGQETGQLLLCKVLLGKSCAVKSLKTGHPLVKAWKPNKKGGYLDLNAKIVKEAGFDSVFAQRDSR